ncbi:hypothetical protein GCM10010954_39080 [Halobacillus andaensis]|uniref:Uncharacterized protein n=1 Tax=Halobacillus andaensis TaxID=1176239 RepID=A0A917BCB8_HALAA|nr:hypothetical protein [Halobacillus andaensis]MBP2006735.1 hypothetical protein [Halobacillus andaensis]GGF36275.1 hypothetical protein GCM10010954_39080 [Halobacillus andaensis]
MVKLIKGKDVLQITNTFVKEKMETLKKKIKESPEPIEVPLLKNGQYFYVRAAAGGVEVSNLHHSPFLPWSVFEETIHLLWANNRPVKKGDAMNNRLGEIELPIDSVEGNIAVKVYNKKEGESVFRRISPVVGILIWSDICRSGKGQLYLKK